MYISFLCYICIFQSSNRFFYIYKASTTKATDKTKEGGATGKADGTEEDGANKAMTGKADGTKEDGATKATDTMKPAGGDAANTPIIAEVSLYIFF